METPVQGGRGTLTTLFGRFFFTQSVDWDLILLPTATQSDTYPIELPGQLFQEDLFSCPLICLVLYFMCLVINKMNKKTFHQEGALSSDRGKKPAKVSYIIEEEEVSSNQRRPRHKPEKIPFHKRLENCR